MITPDYESESENTMGIFIHDTDILNGCRFIEEENFVYSTVTFDDEGPLSVVGPYGNDWTFIDPITFETEHQDWYDQFMAIIEGDS